MTTLPAAPASPYKGLARFDDSDLDAQFFFGRERETELVAANLVATRLTVLYGPSGVGKSSLLRAGVVRRLRALVPAAVGAPEAQGPLPVVVDAWRDDPLLAIAAAAGARAPEPGEQLADVLAERVAERDGELYLVLDQMEEYFVYHGRADGGPLRDALADILSRPELRVHVLLGIRDDALAELDGFKGRVPGLFGNVLRLDHLDLDAARAAIVAPLVELEALGGPKVVAEPALVAAVVDQVASGRIERRLAGRGVVSVASTRGRVEAPYLQLVMERLWEVEREQGSAVLRAETLASLGGAGRIVQEHLERALDRLPEADRDLVGRLFRQLVTPSGTKIAYGVHDLSRYAGEPAERLDGVLQTLSAERVVRAVPGRNGGEPRYEIFHDVLGSAVLDWGARHEAEQTLAEEREEARRRQRRLAAIAAGACVAIAVLGLLTVYAFQQRREAVDARDRAEAEASVAQATSRLTVDPERSLALALEGAETHRANGLERVLRDGLINVRARAVLPGGGGSVSTVVASPDGSLVVVPARGGKARVFEVATGKLVAELEHGPGLHTATFAPDGQSVVTGGGDGIARRWDVRSGDTLAEYPHGAPIREIAFSPDGRRVATAAGEAARVWDAATGDALERLPHPSAVLGVAFNPAGTLLLTVTHNVRLYDVGSWRFKTLDPPGDVVVARFAPRGPLLATGERGGTARLWDATDGSMRRGPLAHHADVLDLAWSPRADYVATASADNGARVWSADTGALYSFLGAHSNHVTAIAFNHDGSALATSSLDGSARVWSGNLYARHAPLLGHRGSVRDVVFTSDGSAVLSASEDGSARIWKPEVDPRLTVLGTHSSPLRSVAVAPTGRLVVTAAVDGTATIWGREGRVVRSLEHDAELTDARFSPDGDEVLTAAVDGVARVWRVDDGRLRRSLKHGAALDAATFSPDGNRIVTAGADGFARVWSWAGRPIRAVEHGGAVTAAAFSPDGASLATAGKDREGRVWRLTDGALLGKLVAHGAPLTSIAYSADGSRLVTSSRDADARVWNAMTLEPVRLLRGHSAMVSEASFSPDGRWIATAGPTTIGLWETRIGARINAGTPQLWLRGHAPAVQGVAFSPSGRSLFSVGDDGTVRTYSCDLCGDADELLRLAELRLAGLGRTLTPDERRRYIGAP